MKKQLFYTVLALLAAHFATAQVLYSENFDNLTLGNIGTDHTGATPGQGGWYTLSRTAPADASNNYFKIVTEPGRGNVMELSAIPNFGANYLQKRGIDTLWNNRTAGNDILKIEYDFFTGEESVISGYNQIFALRTDYNFLENGEGAIFGSKSMLIKPLHTDGYYYFISVSQNMLLQENTWVKLIFYLDYQNQKIYFSIPSNGVLIAKDSLAVNPITTIIIAHLGSKPEYPLFKYDNIIISAVNTVPLSITAFISSKFNIYPNPVTDVVTITNNENIGIEEVAVYDVNGKIVKEQHCENESEVSLNIDSFEAGTYLFHIKTKEGTTVKKVIKN